MPLNIRSTAVSIAVACFFAASLIGWYRGLAPATCCQRALVAAAVGYPVGALAAKAVNAILLSAIINRQIDQRKEQHGGNDY